MSNKGKRPRTPSEEDLEHVSYKRKLGNASRAKVEYFLSSFFTYTYIYLLVALKTRIRQLDGVG